MPLFADDGKSGLWKWLTVSSVNFRRRHANAGVRPGAAMDCSIMDVGAVRMIADC